MSTVFATTATAVIYGVIMLGCIVPVVLVAGTRHYIRNLGYAKYILIIAGWEALMLLFLAAMLFTLPYYYTLVWNRQGMRGVDALIELDFLMIKFILPAYLLIIAIAAGYAKWKESRHIA